MLRISQQLLCRLLPKVHLLCGRLHVSIELSESFQGARVVGRRLVVLTLKEKLVLQKLTVIKVADLNWQELSNDDLGHQE